MIAWGQSEARLQVPTAVANLSGVFTTLHCSCFLPCFSSLPRSVLTLECLAWQILSTQHDVYCTAVF